MYESQVSKRQFRVKFDKFYNVFILLVILLLREQSIGEQRAFNCKDFL